MEDMAQIVAHRIRGLVMTIEGFTDLLADTLPDRDQRELALRIFESAARIESILADLQVYARRRTPACAPTTTTAVLVDLLATLDDAVEARVDVVIPDSPADVNVDSMLLRQALLVLVTNALEASEPAGEVVVRCDAAGDGRQRFRVSNAGVINGSVAELLFQPFFTTKAHNLGVGLNLARRIAESHGGSLELSENDADLGTTFTLELPGSGTGEVVQ